ncbi:MAG TPA: S8 family serine peptidase, partial [Armatimonadota bacterium]|nr:S8 family serine peptidase [Armatimonadota bacterium]
DSWDFGGNDPDPSPVHADDQHGISVAGVAAARGGNGLGITGAAPLAGLAGLRVDFYTQTTAMFVDATLYHSSGADTAIGVKNHSYGYSYPYVPTPAEVDALNASAAVGTIHCAAAGNDRGYMGQDANKQAFQNNPASITVTALGSDGKYAGYSSFGANVFVTAPSSSGGLYGITTTDRTTASAGYNGFPDGDYTAQFGGTSSATPLVAGVMALAKQVQPNLNVRFAKHLLALTSDVVDPTDQSRASDGGWKTNAAGYRFNQNYGFGLIDADELTQKAVEYAGVTPLTTESTGPVIVGAVVPDNDAAGVTRTFALTSTTPLEEVLVGLNVTHAYRGDVEAYLTSPSGTTSRLMIVSGGDSDLNLDWTFSANAFWGENPAGTWTLRVRDQGATDAGTWNAFAVTARMGELASLPPVLQDTAVTVADVSGATGQTVSLTARLQSTTGSVALAGRTLSVSIDGASVGSGVTGQDGVAKVSYKVPEGAASRVIRFAFAGDEQHNSAAGTGVLTVTKAGVLVTVKSDSGGDFSGTPGQQVTLKGNLKRATDSAGLQGRTLTFRIDGVVVGTASTIASGSAWLSCRVPTTAQPGPRPVTVEFAGDTHYNAGSGTGNITVGKSNVMFIVKSDVGGDFSGTPGQQITLKANLKRATDYAALAGRALTFRIDGVAVGTATTVASGSAWLGCRVPATVLPGARVVTVEFAGDTQHNAGSGTGSITIGKANVVIAVKNDSGGDFSGAPGQVVTLKGNLRRATDSAGLGGRSLTFRINGIVVGSATTFASGNTWLGCRVPASLTVGAYAVTVEFAGDEQHNAGTGTGRLTVP